MTGKIQPNAAGGAIFDRFAFSGMAPPCRFTVAGLVVRLSHACLRHILSMKRSEPRHGAQLTQSGSI
jgi:hypothetical protein